MTAPATADSNWRGAVTAVAVVVTWLASLAMLLGLPTPSQAWFWLAAGAWMTFWSTGLFITAHDAMHGTVDPLRPRVNRTLGVVAAGLYAGFGLDALTAAHRRHHAAPASSGDPDYHDGHHPHPVRWYLRFMVHYLTWRQLLTMAVAFNVMSHGFGIDEAKLLGFWVLPVCLSTVQLFYFGTYQPHGRRDETADQHHARSSQRPPWLSLLACFHFDYHWEHHRWPHLAWWQLPRARWQHR